MGQKKVLVKINSEGKYVVDVDKDIDINELRPNTRVALRNDSYTLHKILPTKVDPLVSLTSAPFTFGTSFPHASATLSACSFSIRTNSAIVSHIAIVFSLRNRSTSLRTRADTSS